MSRDNPQWLELYYKNIDYCKDSDAKEERLRAYVAFNTIMFGHNFIFI